MTLSRGVGLQGIYTDRHAPGHEHASWHLLHEWEEGFAEALRLPLVNAATRPPAAASGVTRAMAALARALRGGRGGPRLPRQRGVHLCFTMTPDGPESLSASPYVIPVVIDFWKTVNLRHFSRTYRRCPLVLVSSLEAVTYITQAGCPLHLGHLPLSLPDRYRLARDQEFQKRHDVVVAGRASPVLVSYLHRFAREHPTLDFVQRCDIGGESVYVSSRSGPLGAMVRRDDYMNMLRSARVGLYSTPGMDGGEARTGGFNPVTPRLLELLSAGCHIVARYPRNPDTEYYRLSEFWPSVQSYESFAVQLLRALDTPPPVATSADYLAAHYTSTRVLQLQAYMEHLA